MYGLGIVVGTDPYWGAPQADEQMALMGYRYFLSDEWHWPVFANDAINVPYEKSVAFLDCIPIWALLNKAIATIVPPWRDTAYLGTWHLLAYALQAVFGVAVVRTLGHRSWHTALVAIAFFLAVPAWVFRHAHPALSAHWIELWALLLYLRGAKAGWLPQLAIASLVSPYHPVFSFALLLASLGKTGSIRAFVVWVPVAIATIVGCFAFAGYFAAEVGRPQWGFDMESANVLGWLWPFDATGFQYEGYCYLGIGVLGLLPFALRPARAALGRHVWLALACVLFAVLALSNRIFVGPYQLLHVDIPEILASFPSQFRSPGRFVWLPLYALLAFALHASFTRFATSRWFVLVAALAVVQLVDVSSDWDRQRAVTRPYAELLQRDRWRELVQAHEAVMILPPYSCVFGPDGPIHDVASRQIQLLASERALPINGTYGTRARRKCKQERAAWPTLVPAPATLYVVLAEALAAADRLAAQGAVCIPFVYGRICSTNSNALSRF